MAIAFDAATLSQMNAVTQNSFAHTITGSNPVLIVGVAFATGTDISGTPTYNGVNMTLITSVSIGGTTFDKAYLYGAIAPATGTHNVVINNTGGANFIYAACASYTGAGQISPFDTSATNIGTGTTLSQSVTTTVDNDWLIAHFVGGTLGSNLTAGASTTVRASGPAWNAIGDSNAAKTPPGSYSLAVNASGSEHLSICMTSLKPFGNDAVSNGTFLSFM
jgi:hypothetical protein